MACKFLFGKILIRSNSIINRCTYFQLTAVTNGDVGCVKILAPIRSKSQSSNKKSIHHSVKNHRSTSPVHFKSDSNLLTQFNFANPNKPLFYLNDDTKITYAEFDRSITRYATYLAKNYQAKKGDRIAAQISKSPESIALYLAVLKIGAIYVPLNTDYKKDEIRYFLLNSEPRVFVCRPMNFQIYAELIHEHKMKCQLIDETDLNWKIGALNDQELTEGIEKMKADDLAAICFTSGTTGRPKGAMITHGNLSSNAKTLCEIWRITENDRLLHAMPIYHVHGLFVAVNSILTKGASFLYLPRFDADQVVDRLSEATCMMGVPTYYTRLLQNQRFDRKLCSNIRLFISGSAPLLESTWKEFKSRTGHEILERYGMTEGQMICSNPYDEARKPGTVGRPLPGVSIRIRNSSLEYKGPNLFKGYWRMPEKTKDEFTQDGYFISGDLAEYDSDGYVKIMGRGKDLIITGGLNVYPKEIENAIDELSGVIESAVIAVPHPDFGEAVVAVVVHKGDSKDDVRIRESDMIKILKDRIAAFKIPKRIFFQDQLPRNVMGKVQKNILRDTYRNIFAK